MERAVSPECNEILVSKKFKERMQKPGETITAFITDLILLVKKCNYADEVRQLRDQFVYAVCDEELKKRLLEKGSTHTGVEATAIGKAYESTKLEVQECSAKQPAKESVNAVSNDKLRNILMCNYCVNKKGAHSFLDQNLCPAWGAVCRKCKIKNHYQDSNEYTVRKRETRKTVRSKAFEIVEKTICSESRRRWRTLLRSSGQNMCTQSERRPEESLCKPVAFKETNSCEVSDRLWFYM